VGTAKKDMTGWVASVRIRPDLPQRYGDTEGALSRDLHSHGCLSTAPDSITTVPPFQAKKLRWIHNDLMIESRSNGAIRVLALQLDSYFLKIRGHPRLDSRHHLPLRR
jgi:hypothetical protein